MTLVYATELAPPDDQLVGWGIKIVVDEFGRAGRRVTYVPLEGPRPTPQPDVWLVSVPYAAHAALLPHLARLIGQSFDRTKRDGRTVWLFGGHGIANPEPWLDVADAVFLGEADDRLSEIAHAGADLARLAAVPGIDTGVGLVEWQIAAGLDKRGVYRTAPAKRGGVGATSYLEIARGCRQRCRFCEVGWAYGYTERSWPDTARLMGLAQRHGHDLRSIVLSAPDTDGVSWWDGVLSAGHYNPRWRSTRVRAYLKSRPTGRKAHRGRIRFGVEGVTEQLRLLCGKPFSDADLEQALRRCAREGYRQTRLFLIAGLPTETADDRRHLADIVRMTRGTKPPCNATVGRHWKTDEIKVTGLSPQPFTPWQRLGCGGAIESLAEYRTMQWAMAKVEPGWRTVMVDAQATEADLVKRMHRGELLAYLAVRPEGEVKATPQDRWRQVRDWALAAGIDYDSRVLGPLSGELPWSRVRHPLADQIGRAEAVALRAIGLQGLVDV